MILLDTCGLLWLASEPEKLSQKARHRIEDAAVVYVSAITGFEIGLKQKSGKLRLPVPPQQWLEAVLEHHDISVAELDLDVCVKATQLPPIHKDPCDRFIIATAMQMKVPVVTTDGRFAEYGIEVLA